MSINLQHRSFLSRSFLSVLLSLLASYIFYFIYHAGQDDIRFVEKIYFSFNFSFAQVTMAGIYFGLGLSVLDWFFYVNDSKWYSLGYILLFRSTLNLLALVILSLLIFLSSQILFFGEIPDNTITLFQKAMHSKKTIIIGIYGYMVSFLITFLNNVVFINIGPGILHKLLTGKYKDPKEENRIFMFLDLKSSTTTAEKLGHLKYSQFIQDCFNDLTMVVLHYKADIYQYVGDEVVLTWEKNDGIENLNCIKVFFSFEQVIQAKKNIYQEKYGIVPEFKSGVNSGIVSVAEVGKIKREIAYHGDVINTAARIQEKCNDFNVKILISENLIQNIPQNSEITTKFLGNVKLKGKERSVNIYSAELNVSADEILPLKLKNELLLPLKDGLEWAIKYFSKENDN
jgi:adenylate cyclase